MLATTNRSLAHSTGYNFVIWTLVSNMLSRCHLIQPESHYTQIYNFDNIIGTKRERERDWNGALCAVRARASSMLEFGVWRIQVIAQWLRLRVGLRVWVNRIVHRISPNWLTCRSPCVRYKLDQRQAIRRWIKDPIPNLMSSNRPFPIQLENKLSKIVFWMALCLSPLPSSLLLTSTWRILVAANVRCRALQRSANGIFIYCMNNSEIKLNCGNWHGKTVHAN